MCGIDAKINKNKNENQVYFSNIAAEYTKQARGVQQAEMKKKKNLMPINWFSRRGERERSLLLLVYRLS